MPLTSKIREQIINSFRAELVEHVQTLNDGLLALEQNKITGKEREDLLGNVFRAAHSLKGAARAVGVGAVEQLAHALEDVLGLMQRGEANLSSDLFTACYQALDAIQAIEAVYEAGEVTPPAEALTALAGLDPFRHSQNSGTAAPAAPQQEEMPPAAIPEAATAPEKPEVEVIPAVKPISAPLQPAAADETIRVSVSKLDALMAQLSELLITKIRAEQRLGQVQQAQKYIAHWQKEWVAERGEFSRLVRQDISSITSIDLARTKKDLSHLLEYVSSSQNRLREMTTLINNLSREYHSDTMQMSLVIDGLEEEIKRVRMLPLTLITGSFGRMVRDLAQASGKEAVLEIIGGDVELDKRVLEQIKDPIVHLLRNAVDHGIEMPKKRLAAGKPACGRITLLAEQQGKDIAISVADDGQGLDTNTIRQVAMRRGIDHAASMTDAELIEIIYNPGFSTSPIITDVSGRGVGLDVVRKNIETLRGRINVNWTPGAGSRFTLYIPLALTSSRGLLVRVSNQLFAIPLNAIERILYVQSEDIEPVGGFDTLQYEGRPLMLVHLGNVLNLPSHTSIHSGERIPTIILSAVERRMAFAVDELADEQEVVIKGLGKQLTRVGGIAGASVMGNGEVILTLNIADLIKLAHRSEWRSILNQSHQTEASTPTAGSRTTAVQTRRHILVVDDSITTRTLEKNILEAAGFEVQLAMDGQEAYNIVSMGNPPDLIISDVSMPHMDGFGLAQRVKTNPNTSKIPLILVTSLDSPEDKARGIECGADAYIIKSRFDQNNLLETIEQLI